MYACEEMCYMATYNGFLVSRYINGVASLCTKDDDGWPKITDPVHFNEFTNMFF